MGKPEYSNAERKLLIEAARMKGMSDGEIFRRVVMRTLGADNRKLVIIQWGELMGMDATQALRTAQRAGVVLTVRRPRKSD
jgi:hypothetical protein